MIAFHFVSEVASAICGVLRGSGQSQPSKNRKARFFLSSQMRAFKFMLDSSQPPLQFFSWFSHSRVRMMLPQPQHGTQHGPDPKRLAEASVCKSEIKQHEAWRGNRSISDAFRPKSKKPVKRGLKGIPRRVSGVVLLPGVMLPDFKIFVQQLSPAFSQYWVTSRNT